MSDKPNDELTGDDAPRSLRELLNSLVDNVLNDDPVTANEVYDEILNRFGRL